MQPWFLEQEPSSNPDAIHLQVLPDVRQLDPRELESDSRPRPHWTNRSLQLGGKAPVWAYARLAYLAVQSGAKEVRVFHPPLQESCPEGISVYPLRSTSASSEDNACWYSMQELELEGTCRMSILEAPSGQTYWPVDAVQAQPPKFPPGTRSVVLAGRGGCWMYALAACAVARAGIRQLACEIPQMGGLVSVGDLNPGQMEETARLEPPGGLVLGVVGDPNSGKSVFSTFLTRILRSAWPDCWLYDGDQASPTSDWYLRMTRQSAEKEAKNLRDRIKRDWTHEMELQAANDLRLLKRNLHVVVADLPGGKHPKHPEDPSKPERIPDGREVMMREVDAFIVLGRGGRPEIIPAWRKELARHQLEGRIWVECESREPDQAFHLALQSKDGLLTGECHGLDRRKIPDSLCGLQSEGSSLAPLFARIEEYLQAGGCHDKFRER